MTGQASTGVHAQKPIDLHRILAELRAALPDLRERCGVKSLAVFGSYVRGDQRPGSDVDVLVEFDVTPDLFELVGLEDRLSRLLGVKVDVVMKSTLRPAISRRVLKELVPV